MDMFKLVLQCDVRKEEMLQYNCHSIIVFHHKSGLLYLCNVEPPSVVSTTCLVSIPHWRHDFNHYMDYYFSWKCITSICITLSSYELFTTLVCNCMFSHRAPCIYCGKAAGCPIAM